MPEIKKASCPQLVPDFAPDIKAPDLEQNVFGMPQDRLAQRYTKMDMPKVDAPKIPVQLPVAVATTWIPASKVQVQSEPKISMPKFDMPKISSPTGGYDLDIPVGEGSRVTCLGFFQPLGGGGGSRLLTYRLLPQEVRIGPPSLWRLPRC
jgi:hypothetical protein